MIYFTTLILTLLLSHIARAMPACDGASPSVEELYDLAYDDSAFSTPEELYEYDPTDEEGLAPLVATYHITWDGVYDNPNGNTDSVACSNGPHGLSSKYPHFHNFPHFPYLGGAFDTKWGSPNCGKCWELRYNKRHIYVAAIDYAGNGFNIGKKAFIALNGGSIGGGTLEAEARPAHPKFCDFH